MELSVDNRLRIVDYLKSTDAFKPVDVKDIAKHLDKLVRLEQIDGAEDTDGNLIYVWAWWKMTDKALADYKQLKPPRRIDRGKNMVGIFGMNDGLDVTSMLRVIRRNVRGERAKTFTIYTTRKKWITINIKPRRKLASKHRRVILPRALELLKGVA